MNRTISLALLSMLLAACGGAREVTSPTAECCVVCDEDVSQSCWGGCIGLAEVCPERPEPAVWCACTAPRRSTVLGR